MSDFTVSIKCPPYLKQFYIKMCGGTHPVTLRKGSPESALVKVLLEIRPEAAPPDIPADDDLIIFLPYSKAKDPRVFNWLSPKAKEALLEFIRSHFDRKIWYDIGIIRELPRRLDALIEAWMLANGIEITDTNYQAVIKRFRRMQKLDADASRKRKKYTRLSDPSA